jgi:GT2 family glycosyltransferase
VIPSHSRADLLRLCLASVQRHAPDGTEVIVVDDASPRGAVSEAAAGFSGVRVLRLTRHSGFCAAANTGLRAATHPIAELLNDDTEVEAGWAGAALTWFDDRSVAAVAPLVLQRQDGHKCAKAVSAVGQDPKTADSAVAHARIDSAGDRYYLGGVAGKRGRGKPVGRVYLHACPVFGASASSAFYRRDVVLAAGGFPESFAAYFEDVDLSFRLHRAGFRIIYEPGSRVWHHVSASYGPPCRELLMQQARNEERVFWRNLPGRALFRALPLHLAVVAAKAWRRWREGRLLPFLRGKLGVLGEAAELLRHRRRLRSLGSGRDWPAWGVEGRFWA